MIRALAAALMLVPTAAHAQSQWDTVTIQFSSNPKEYGYTSGSVDLRFGFLLCAGDIVIAYEVLPHTAKASGMYVFEGVRRSVPRHIPPPQRSYVRLDGYVGWGSYTGVGPVLDPSALAWPLGQNCFSGQTKVIAEVKDFRKWLAPNASELERKNFLNAFRLSRVQPDPSPLRSSEAEDYFRAERQKAKQDSVARLTQLRADSLRRLSAARKDSLAREHSRQREEAIRKAEEVERERQAAEESEPGAEQSGVDLDRAGLERGLAVARSRRAEEARQQLQLELELARAQRAEGARAKAAMEALREEIESENNAATSAKSVEQSRLAGEEAAKAAALARWREELAPADELTAMREALSGSVPPGGSYSFLYYEGHEGGANSPPDRRCAVTDVFWHPPYPLKSLDLLTRRFASASAISVGGDQLKYHVRMRSEPGKPPLSRYEATKARDKVLEWCRKDETGQRRPSSNCAQGAVCLAFPWRPKPYYPTTDVSFARLISQ